jgi:hypothetical protein
VGCAVRDMGCGGLCGFIEVPTGDKGCGMWSRQSEGGGEHFMPLKGVNVGEILNALFYWENIDSEEWD